MRRHIDGIDSARKQGRSQNADPTHNRSTADSRRLCTFIKRKARVAQSLAFPLLLLSVLALVVVTLAVNVNSFLLAPGKRSHSDLPVDFNPGCAIPSGPLLGVSVEELAANIRRSFDRFNSVEVNQALRRERGPPSYVYAGAAAARHPEDSIRTVKAKFFVYCSKLTDFTRLSALTAALTGIRLECIGYDWKRFSPINRFSPALGYLLASENSNYFENFLDKLNDEDVVTLADADVVYSGDADVYSLMRSFASVTAHSAAEHQRMTTRDPREAAGSVRWTRYTRDVRTDSALAPFIVNSENTCWLRGLQKCDEYYSDVFSLHDAFLKQQKRSRMRHLAKPDTADQEGEYDVSLNASSPQYRVNGGFFLVRVWALRRVLLAAQNLVHTLPNCTRQECTYPIPGSPKHVVGAHRTGGNDQTFLGLLYLRSRMQEYAPGGPLAVDFSDVGAAAGGSGTEAVAAAPVERSLAKFMHNAYDMTFNSSFIPAGAPDTGGASLRLQGGMIMLDWHSLFTQVIHDFNAMFKEHDTYASNASWPRAARGKALYFNSLRPHETAMALRFEERRQCPTKAECCGAHTGISDVPPLDRSPLGNVLGEHIVVLNPKKHTFACRATEVEENGTCSSLSFLRAASLITADSPITFPPRNDVVATRPFVWHFPGPLKRALTTQYLSLLPQLYPLLHPLANHARAARELVRLAELLPPLRVWRLVGACGDVDAYRGGEGTGRAVTEELIRRSTRELGCLPAAATPDLLPLGDPEKRVGLLWAARRRR